VKKQLDAEIIFEDEDIIVFHDIHPQAPVHVLVIPKMHVCSIMDIERLGKDTLYKIFLTIEKIAKELDLLNNGFRVLTNTGKGAGQSVDHLHFHVLGKRKLNWPPG
jgi:histidine triad (HIT) family protein